MRAQGGAQRQIRARRVGRTAGLCWAEPGGPRQRRSAGGAVTAATLSAVPRCRPLRASPPSTDAELQVERRRRLRRPANLLILRWPHEYLAAASQQAALVCGAARRGGVDLHSPCKLVEVLEAQGAASWGPGRAVQQQRRHVDRTVGALGADAPGPPRSGGVGSGSLPGQVGRARRAGSHCIGVHPRGIIGLSSHCGSWHGNVGEITKMSSTIHITLLFNHSFHFISSIFG